MKTKATSKLFNIFLVLTLAMAILASTNMFAHESYGASSNSLQLSLAVAPTNITSSTNSSYPFAPFDLVYVTANISYASQPQANVAATFKIVGPANATSPNTIIRTALSDQTGLATVSFRLPLGDISGNPTIGIWKANCTASELGQIAQDNITFNVTYPAVIQNITITDQNGTQFNTFSKGQNVKAQIDVLNNRAQPLSSILVMNLTDASGKQSTVISENQTLNGQLNKIKTEFSISNSSSIGKANLEVYLYTIINGQNIPCADPKNISFNITEASINSTQPAGYPSIALTNANLSATKVTRGDPVKVIVSVLNKGDLQEQSTLHIDYSQTEAGTLPVSLPPNQETNFTFTWNTTTVIPGSYIVTAHIDLVPRENETNNHDITAGTITITEKTNTPEPPLVSTSLYILMLVVIGFIVFSLLSFLKFRKHKETTTTETLVVAQQELTAIKENVNATSKQEVTFARSVPLIQLPLTDKEDIEKLPEDSTSGSSIEKTLAQSQLEYRKLVNDLRSLQLQSIEELPPATRALALTAQKIRILKGLKSEREQLLLEIAELDRIVEIQTKNIGTEISGLKEQLEKIQTMTSKQVDKSAEDQKNVDKPDLENAETTNEHPQNDKSKENENQDNANIEETSTENSA